MASWRSCSKSLVMVWFSVAALLAGCGGSDSTASQGIAESNVTTVESAATSAPAVGSSDTNETTGDSEPGDDGAETDDGDGSGTESQLSSPSEYLVYDLNYDVPDQLLDVTSQGEFRNLLIDIHGPTDDLPAQLDRLGFFPAEFPTLPETDILEFSQTSTYPEEASIEPSQKVSVRFSTSADAATVTETVEAALTPPRFQVTGTADNTQDDIDVHTISYEIATSPDIGVAATATLRVISGDFDGTIVEFDIEEGLNTADAVVLFDEMKASEAWFGENPPTPIRVSPRRVLITTNIIPGIFGDGRLSIGIRMSWYDTTFTNEAELVQATLDAIDDAGWEPRIREGEPTHQEAAQAALEDEEGYVSFLVNRPGHSETGSVTIQALGLGGSKSPYVSVDSGFINAFEAP